MIISIPPLSINGPIKVLKTNQSQKPLGNATHISGYSIYLKASLWVLYTVLNVDEIAKKENTQCLSHLPLIYCSTIIP